MIKRYLVLIASLISVAVLGQNLVPNPSFETISNCADTVSPIAASSIINPWIAPTAGGAESYNAACGVGCTGMGTPCNIIAYQPTHTGVGYAGILAGIGNIITGLDNERGYIQVQLTTPLTAGQDYCVEFYASLANNPIADVTAINSLGAYLSTNALASTNINNLNVTPQIVSSSFVTDTLGWTLIKGTFTAAGGEQYITIGNFKNGATTQTQVIGTPLSGILFSYYFIDDVSVTSGSCNPITSCDSTINPFGPLCLTDAPSNLTAVTPGGTWSGTGITSASAGTFSPALAGVGTHLITYTLGCGTTNTKNVVVNNCPSTVIVDFTASQDTVCSGSCVTFVNNSSGSGIANYGWSFSGGTPATYVGATPPSVCFNTVGNHVVTLVAADVTNAPLGNKSKTIVVKTCTVLTPKVNFTASKNNICRDECISFTDQSFAIVGTGTYNWSFPGALTTSSTARNPSNICYPNIGTYPVSLAVTDNNGTGDTTMTGFITVSECLPPVPSFTISNNNICLGSCIDFTNTSTNATHYEWIFTGGFPGGSTDENPTNICFNTIGVYEAKLIAYNSFTSDTLTQTITVSQPPLIIISDSVTIFQGTNTVLSIETDGVSYVWSPDETLNCEDCLSTLATPDTTTLYSVVVIAGNGCAVTAQVLVTVIPVEAIGVPTAFSPNGDQVNDILFIKGAGIAKMNFNIYNRYGQKVFESNTQAIGWDGTVKGKKENPGVFAYTLEYVLNSGESGVLKGNITLVK